MQYDTMAEKKEAQRKEAEALGPEALAAFERKEAVAKASYGQKAL